MAVRLDHTIVWSSDQDASAAFLARILGIGPPGHFGRFTTLEDANGVSFDFANATDIHPQHYAFLVGDEEFDPIFSRVKDEGIEFFADPGQSQSGEINTRWGGRGFYFRDPDGHSMEVLTRRYGSS